MTQLDTVAAIKPTPAELAILTVLWTAGPSTVRAVHDVISTQNGSGYTTVLKLLQIMHRKGLVTRDDSNRAHIYRPHSSRTEVRSQLTLDLVKRAFDGSPAKLVEHALAQVQSSSLDEWRKIRRIISKLEEEHSE